MINFKNIIKEPRIFLRKLEVEDVVTEYVGWINNEKLQAYTRRRGKKTDAEELKKFILDGEKTNDHYFAIILIKNKKHIGNIFLNSVDLQGKSADVSIMIGDVKEHGKGYATEAIFNVCRFAFDILLLNRLTAGSANPCFNNLIKKLGWKLDRIDKKAFLLEDDNVDILFWSLSKKVFLKNKYQTKYNT